MNEAQQGFQIPDQSLSTPVGWLPELKKIGYDDPLYAPSLATQVALACIADPNIHSYVQKMDLVAMNNKDKDGEHAPLLLEVLDLGHWTSIMLAAVDDEDGLLQLQQAHAVLESLLERDELELEESERNLKIVQAALAKANPQEKVEESASDMLVTNLEDSGPSVELHPWISKLNLGQDKTAVSDLKKSIVYIQSEQEGAYLETTGGEPSVPFLPVRIVEHLLASQAHRTWCLKNKNVLLPITAAMWKFWANLSNKEIKMCEDHALNMTPHFKSLTRLPNAFPLAVYDHHKCPTTTVQMLVKQDVLTCPPRIKKYTTTYSGTVDVLTSDVPAMVLLSKAAEVQSSSLIMLYGSCSIIWSNFLMQPIRIYRLNLQLSLHG